MSFSAIPLWMACLLWCAGLACADGRSSFAGEGMHVWKTTDGVAKVIPAVVGSEPVKCAAKPRVIEPVWPHAIEGGMTRIGFYANAQTYGWVAAVAPDLEKSTWVGVIELRI